MKQFLYTLASISLIVVVLFSESYADDSLPPPSDYSIKSANGKFIVFFSVADKKTRVYEYFNKQKKKKNLIWEMDGWYRNTFLSNDGENLVIVYDGANLLDYDYKKDQIMISFYSKGKLLREIKLNQIIENPIPENLLETVSHYKWVDTYGINEKQLFEVNTIKNQTFKFNLKTGELIEGVLYNVNESQPTQKTEDSKDVQLSSNRIDGIEKSKNSQNNCQSVIGGFVLAIMVLCFGKKV